MFARANKLYLYKNTPRLLGSQSIYIKTRVRLADLLQNYMIND